MNGLCLFRSINGVCFLQQWSSIYLPTTRPDESSILANVRYALSIVLRSRSLLFFQTFYFVFHLCSGQPSIRFAAFNATFSASSNSLDVCFFLFFCSAAEDCLFYSFVICEYPMFVNKIEQKWRRWVFATRSTIHLIPWTGEKISHDFYVEIVYEPTFYGLRLYLYLNTHTQSDHHGLFTHALLWYDSDFCLMVAVRRLAFEPRRAICLFQC